MYSYYSKANYYENYHLMTRNLQNFDENLKRLIKWFWRVLAWNRMADLHRISKPSLSNFKIFASAIFLKITEFASAIVWNTSAINIANINLRYGNKMADHVGNSQLALKFVSVSFLIQKCNLKPTLLPVA